MFEIKNGTVLYHGSYIEVKAPDLRVCSDYKDFGKGFYLTTSKAQAESFAKIKTAKVKADGNVLPSQDFGIVSKYVIKNLEALSTKVYSEADKDWLHCIVGHRKRNTFYDIVQELQYYDLICGKIANDSTNLTISAYMINTFGKIGTAQADTICIQLLLPNHLENQYCFRTEKAIECLEFVGSEKIWMNK